ncbi:proline-rich protein 3-like [Apis laboriosa]|uniref:proline-rich protein 3-like n=1 Tax=Apis laboriosa TaxID=183418 RepID=UPI001CC59FFF|nr:proline-rich protein 3-like [Apis laboriosa]
MFRLLIPCLIWLSSVRSETSVSMHMPEGMMEDKAAMKRESYYNPCPPTYAHPISYSPPPQIYVKPYVQQAPLQYIPKPSITYVKPSPPPVIVPPVVKPAPVIVKPIAQPKVVYPIYQKPMISYAPIYQKPVYYAPMYQKLMYQAPKVYLKKYELPAITQVITAQKSHVSYPIQYHEPKVVQVPAPQINYVKLAQPIVHSPPVYQSAIKPYCP